MTRFKQTKMKKLLIGEMERLLGGESKYKWKQIVTMNPKKL